MNFDDTAPLEGGDLPEIQLDSNVPATLETQSIGSVVLAPAPAFDTEPYNPAKTRETFRGRIALILIGLMTGIVIASFALFWLHPDRIGSLKDLLGLIFGPVVALVGAATGYYFVSQSANRS